MSHHLRGDALRLADILTAARLIAAYISGCEKDFLESSKTRDAVIRELEVIGEAAGNVSAPIRNFHPEIPWWAMGGFESFSKLESWRLDVRRFWAAAVA